MKAVILMILLHHVADYTLHWQPVWEYWMANIATPDDDKHCNEPFLRWLFHKKEAGNAGESR